MSADGTATNVGVHIYMSAVTVDRTCLSVAFATEAYTLNTPVCEEHCYYLPSLLARVGITRGSGSTGHKSVTDVTSHDY